MAKKLGLSIENCAQTHEIYLNFGKVETVKNCYKKHNFKKEPGYLHY